MNLDVVYINKNRGFSAELKHSLRTLKNIPHRDVYIIGEKPAWATNIKFIKVAQNTGKYENAIRNLYEICKIKELSEDFIYMNDDFFILEKIDEIPNLNRGTISDVIYWYEQRKIFDSKYVNTMRELDSILKAMGIEEPLSYELHTPMVFNKKKLKKSLDKQIKISGDKTIRNYRTFYGNLYSLGGESIDDVKIYDNLSISRPDWTFVSTSDSSFNNGKIGKRLKLTYRRKSKYEK